MNPIVKYSVLAIVFILIGVWIGYGIYYTKPVPSTPAPAIIQHDGSEVVRVVDTVVKIKQVIPKGYVRERVIQITAKPKDTLYSVDTVYNNDTLIITKVNECGDVTVDISIVKNKKDDSRRVVVSSQDGTIVASKDIPIEDLKPIKSLKWAIGVTGRYDIIDSTPQVGAFVNRNVGPFVVGADISGWKSNISIGAKFGIRF